MPRYVNADRLISVFDILKKWGFISKTTFEKIRKTIAEIDSADVVEVRHGRWEYVDSDLGWRNEKCSVCGKIITVYDEDDSHNYCCNCGARMDGVNDV